ncbi:hypothetical protein [Hymenobacter ruricola]|uniref:DprA winged helix domain-containing protein n=1 Tax=Hymenobacter ruricola TaxID=2791023 RepID=A0ABS0I3G2_9BACT|nr:hypothetical protein [Hymenobacter ruricola]MBF9221468.1 hypothetical protein [Hymenobacter ruricola]
MVVSQLFNEASEILTRLLRLNHERAREELAGHIRYLRPAYQAKGNKEQGVGNTGAQATIDLALSPAPTSSIPFPTELAQQMQALRDAVAQAGQPITATQVAAGFKRLKPEKVESLLATLVALSLVRQTPESTYAA